ncbi:MAG: MMPL family transporter, partial [Sedimentisphaerales bacterium]|nr:MMPL family transporter [Sedimentisphaerales bacterium]
AHHADKESRSAKLLNRIGNLTYTRAKPILAVVVLITAGALYGITRIQINDNPVKWFSKSHPIRQADIELNKHFGGTYMAYLVLEDAAEDGISDKFVKSLQSRWQEKLSGIEKEKPGTAVSLGDIDKLLASGTADKKAVDQYLDGFIEVANKKLQAAEGSGEDAAVDLWYEVVDFFELEKERLKLFKQPEVLEYMAKLQSYLQESGLAGKSNSVADVVKKIHQELIDGRQESYIIPGTSAAVAQCLLQFQSSHNPEDLWHLVTYDYMKANIWIQLTSGDNKDMEKVVHGVNEFFTRTPPPVPLKHNWAGLTYINTVWQEKMVFGMLQSFLGSFIIVFIMMTILFRSPLWGIICMIPLTVTIVVIYGIIGLVGKDYDMPVAVLSALTLGMAVDFAIHFLERARASFSETNSWQLSAGVMFGEPAMAISRNVLVIAIGFLPLLAAPLVPYKTVGIFLCAIMALSGMITLMALPAMIRIAEKLLFKVKPAPKSVGCNCGFCIVIAAATVVLVAVNLHQYWQLGWSKLAWISTIAIPVMALVCGIMSRRQACKRTQKNESEV